METVGMRPILVHGGGKAIDRAMSAAGLKPLDSDADLSKVARSLSDDRAKGQGTILKVTPATTKSTTKK